MGLQYVAAVCIVAAECVSQVLAYPIAPEGSGREDGWSSRDYVHATIGVAALLSSVTTLLACVCCKRSRGFKELGSVSSRVEGSTTTISHGPREEFTMFPPAGLSQLSLSTTQINFEPLPDIRPRLGTRSSNQQITDRTLPPSFPGQVTSTPTGLHTDEWFAEPHQNFPRNQLQYVREIGKGWFGQVLEGRATGIFSDHTKGDSPVTSSVTPNTSSRGQTPVAVKVLREDATPTEQMYFLHELRPYRDLSHPNVLKVLAHCLETEPFLILMQLCPRGDLKAVVKHDKSLRESALLRMILDVASGLMHMHSYSFIHTDLAARNCVVDEDYVVKIGDYGYNIDFYKNEYYCAGDVALPLRWCAPETLRCTDTTIETKEVTKAANVWSFGVMIWEIVSRGEMPYTNLNDDQVIQQVIVDQTCLLEPPKSLVLHADKLFDIMKLCWDPEYCRPPMTHIHSLLMHLWENSSVACQDTSSISDFEQRWDQLQQQHCRDHSIVHGGNSSDLRFESDFSLSVSGHRHLGGAMSPSLQNLHGSVEDLDAKMAAKFGSALPSWLGVEPGQPIDSLTQEITDAILKLDDYLAGEKSEPSTTQTSPEKGGINFKLGKDSFVSNPPESKIARAGRLSVEEGSGHPSLTRTLSEGEDDGFSLRLEQGEFTEMVRLKSQSVQDFMKLTVVDDGSDSDNASQRNSLAFDTLAQEKTYSSESNIREALRDMKFMGELERLQAQHRYSIITEASRENPSSIEYRIQDFDADPSLSRSEILLDSEAGSTDRLATSTDSDNSNNFHERQNSEQDPFLGEVTSSESTEERKDYFCDIKEGNNNSFHSLDTSVGPKPLPASPDCVVSSREPKPATLPDIVVHDASVKLSTPSPPPVESSLKVINSNQAKEFRFIFENQSDPSSTGEAKFSYMDVHERLPHMDSVTFSENIRNAEVHRTEEFGNSDKEGNSCQKMNGIDANDSLIVKKLSDNDHEEDSHKMGDITKFLDYVQENTRERLTSTPCKKDDENSLKSEEMEEKAYTTTFSSNISDNKDTNCIVDKNLSVDGENLNISKSDTKQRLVFGSNIDKTEDENHSTKEEHTVLEVEDNLESPSYKPEKIVKGEDVVIGALEDYSLDLYRAVKSTEVLRSGDESVQVPSLPVEEHSSGISNMSSNSENKVSGIEFDLEQWDRFLGSAMNGEKATSESIFKEGFDESAGVKCDLVNDVLGDTFEKTENNSVSQKDIEPFLNVYPKCSTPNKPDLSSTFEHSTCDEICAVMASDSNVESNFVENRPEVNVNMFFSSNSNVSNGQDNGPCLQHTSDRGQNGPTNICDIESFLNDSTNQKSKFSDESYFTAESSTLTTELVSPREVSELYKSATSHFDSDSRTPINETNSVNAGNSTSPKMNQVNDAQCSPNISYGITDTPSDSFTYMRESSVDSTFEVVNHNETSFLGKQPKCKDEVNKVDLYQNSAVNIQDPCICGDELDAVLIKSKNSFKSDVNRGVDVNDCNMKSSVKNNDSLFKISSTPVDSGFSMTSNILNLEDASSASNTDSSVLRLEDTDSNTQENFTLRDEDDLSPSAYKSKLKYNDCWTSQESQDSAVENDEAENGDFWQQQMMAWQEAAFETRQLLQQAAGGSGTSSEGHKGSQEDLEASPRSDSSSTKSPYSSSDMLSLDDEGTYVSYNTTDDEEVLGYKPEDISALRAELNRKLGSLQEDKEQLVPEELDETSSTDREDRENIVINYRGIMATTLSPIKEESFLEDDDSPARKLNNKCSGNLEPFHDQSIEFEEPSSETLADKPTKDDKTFAIHEAINDIIVNEQQPGVNELPSCEDIIDTDIKNSKDRKILNNSCATANEVQKSMSLNLTMETLKETLSLEDAHDSLILEDLDDDGPSSIQIYNSGNSADAEDILIVDTETNEATIVDRGKPRSHLAFINDHEKEIETNEIQLYTYEESDDVAPESIPSVGRSCIDEMHHRHHTLTNKPLEKPGSLQLEGCEDSESKHERQFVTDAVSSESPQGIQVPHYHSYFTSALSTISHPNASIEEPPLFEEVEHISLPYDVNYPSAGEQLHSLEDFGEQGEDTENHISNNKEEEAKISEIEDDDDAPIKLNFLGRLYSDESEEQDEKNSSKSSEAREALILSGSEKENDADKQVARPKTPEPSDISQMTASEFLASQKCQINDHEEIEEQIEIDAGYDEDSEDDENSPRLNPGKLNQVEFHVTQDPRYTPDWESDSDSDGDSSSTSGEFMWRPGEQCQQSSYILDVIEEEPENDVERVDDDGDFSEDSESGEEEFTPSKWNCDLTPSHSLLRSPQNRSSLKKRVRWKRQRHHRVYEYPPEPRSWEPTPTEPNPRRSWGRSSLDYLSLADWELGADEFIADDGGDMEDYVYRKPSRPAPPPPIYSLGSVAYDDAAEGFLVDNGEFFIRSSGSPFTFTSSTFSASDFFPGSHSSDYDVIFGGPSQTPGLSDALSNKLVDHIGDEGEEMYDEQMRESKSDTENHTSNADVSVSHLHYQVVDETEQSSSANTGLGQLRHTRDKLRLEIPTISLTGDATKSTTITHENGQNELEKCNGQNFTSMNLTRTEPEVSEV